MYEIGKRVVDIEAIFLILMKVCYTFIYTKAWNFLKHKTERSHVK